MHNEFINTSYEMSAWFGVWANPETFMYVGFYGPIIETLIE